MATRTSSTTQNLEPQIEGKLVHTEFITNDPKSLRSFLEKTFNWKFETFPTGSGPDYHMFTTPGGAAGGLTAPPTPNAPISTCAYIACDDVKATAKRVEKNGAKIVVPPTEIPNMGWFCQFQVKGGPVLAIWQAPNNNG